MEKDVDRLLDLLNKEQVDAIVGKCVKAACSSKACNYSEKSQHLIKEAVHLFLAEFQKHVVIKPRGRRGL